jgi:predicted GNAT family N-acyltransferase
MALKQIIYGTPEYEQMVKLRLDVLRAPLGLHFTDTELAAEKEDILIASYDEEQILACCILTPADKKTVRLRQMAVAGNLQGKGIGVSIMHFAETLARDKGFTKLTMHARQAAMGFYEKLGYKPVGQQFTEVTIPHFVMEKRL